MFVFLAPAAGAQERGTPGTGAHHAADGDGSSSNARAATGLLLVGGWALVGGGILWRGRKNRRTVSAATAPEEAGADHRPPRGAPPVSDRSREQGSTEQETPAALDAETDAEGDEGASG